MNPRPILDLLSPEHGLDQIARNSADHRAAAAVLDGLLAEFAGQVVDGRFIEVPAMRLIDAAAAAGVDGPLMVLTLNLIRKDVCSFGGRRGNELLTESDTVALLARVARGLESGADVVPVYRFESALLLDATQALPA